MPLLHHLLIALSYAVVAAILAVALPYNFPALAPGESLLLGGGSRFESELIWLRMRHAELADELARARHETRQILEAVENTKSARQGQSANIGKVMDEVRLLQVSSSNIRIDTGPPPAASSRYPSGNYPRRWPRPTPCRSAVRSRSA